MMGQLAGYLGPVLQACLLFPVVAGLFTIPFMVINYRKYGGIALMRVLVVYSMILYMMCAFLLTVLPLPSRSAVAAMEPKPFCWIPLTDLRVGMEKAGMPWSDPVSMLDLAHWRTYLTSRDLFQIIANIVMQVPLGFYLRYYFRCSWKRTAAVGFLVSLFYELTQLSGLFFIYPQAYRYATVDDLLNNTLGALLGYALTPLLALLLPSREEIDRISYRKGEQLTLIRRALAAVLDMMLLSLAEGMLLLWQPARIVPMGIVTFGIYFVLVPWMTGGRTPGQALLKIRVVQEETLRRPGLLQLLVRNVLLYMA